MVPQCVAYGLPEISVAMINGITPKILFFSPLHPRIIWVEEMTKVVLQTCALKFEVHLGTNEGVCTLKDMQSLNKIDSNSTTNSICHYI